MRRRRRADAANLDSLLDTMANVTGILVVLLAVTQISVGNAMERLRDQVAVRPELSQEAMTAAEEEALGLETALAELLPGAGKREAERRGLRSDLSALRSRVASLDRELAPLREAPRSEEDLARRLATARSDAHRLERGIEAERRELAFLEKEFARAATPTPRDARLPDPRPAPVGARELAFFVRHGRILRVDGQQLVDRLWSAIRAATGGSSAERIQRSSLDRGRVLRYFQSNDVGNASLRWHVIDVGGTLTGQLAWRNEEAGDSLEQLRSGVSRYRQELFGNAPSRAYVRFFVWDDSFEVYLEARALADTLGYAAGWVPFGAHTPFRQQLTHETVRAFVD